MRYLTIVMFLVGCVAAIAYYAWLDVDVLPDSTPQETGIDARNVDASIPTDLATHIAEKANLITVTEPKPFATVTSPFSVRGFARGYWFFEASFPVVVTDWDGLIIGEGIATAEDEWMTEAFVPFTGTVSFTVASNTPYQRGILIFKKDNPSGLPEHDDALEIPVQFNYE